MPHVYGVMMRHDVSCSMHMLCPSENLSLALTPVDDDAVASSYLLGATHDATVIIE